VVANVSRTVIDAVRRPMPMSRWCRSRRRLKFSRQRLAARARGQRRQIGHGLAEPSMILRGPDLTIAMSAAAEDHARELVRSSRAF